MFYETWLTFILFFNLFLVKVNLELKRQSNEILVPQFFSSFKPAWATDQRVKIFSNLVSFSLRYSKFSIENTDSAQYDTARSQNKFLS